MEKKVFVLKKDSFECHGNPGEKWTEKDICDAYWRQTALDQREVAVYDTKEEALEALKEEPVMSREFRTAGTYFEFQVAFVDEEYRDYDDDGDFDYSDVNMIAFKADEINSNED